MNFQNIVAVSFLLFSVMCFADSDYEKSEFRIYYYDDHGLVFDQGHGVREYSDAIKHMNKTASPRAGWSRFRPLCGKMVSEVTCEKFDFDTNKPGSDYFCDHLSEYMSDTFKGIDEAGSNALEDLCEAHFARPVDRKPIWADKWKG